MFSDNFFFLLTEHIVSPTKDDAEVGDVVHSTEFV